MRTHYVYYSYEEFGRGYIGVRTAPEGISPTEDTYMGSFTDKSFDPKSKIVIATFETRDEAERAERVLHEFYDVDINPHFANIVKQISAGFSWAGRSHSEETKERLSKRSWYNNGIENLFVWPGETPPDGFEKGMLPLSEEAREKVSKGNKGKKLYGEHKINFSKSQLGKPLSDYQRQRIIESNKTRKYSEETLEKMSKARKCKKWYQNGEIQIQVKIGDGVPVGFVEGRLPYSEDACKKISEGKKGKKLSEEAKERLRGGRCYTDGINTKRFRDGDEIPDGWKLGVAKTEAQEEAQKRAIGKKWINNGVEQRIVPPDTVLPDGWVLGMLPKK